MLASGVAWRGRRGRCLWASCSSSSVWRASAGSWVAVALRKSSVGLLSGLWGLGVALVVSLVSSSECIEELLDLGRLEMFRAMV